MSEFGGKVHPSILHCDVSSHVLSRTTSESHEGFHGQSEFLGAARQKRERRNVGKEEVYDMFIDGEWAELFRCSRKCGEDMASVNRRR